MKYVMSKKIKTFSAVNDWQGLGEKNAKILEAGKIVELKNPPKHLITGRYIVEAENKGAK
tara:strand:- start:3549 stop:3728 length:180 start_codon:yes stop_codon:yes gene_type:complete